MKAAFLIEPEKIEIREVEIPKPQKNEVLVKIKNVGICGTDKHIYKSGQLALARVKLPFILGHECSGEVVDLGKDVMGIKIGDRVTVEPSNTCGICEFCKRGLYNMCVDYKPLGMPPDNQGVMAQYIAHRYDRCFLLPETISFEEGALIEPLAIVIHALNLTNFKIGDEVLILGAGSIGLLMLMLLKAIGAGRCFIGSGNNFKLNLARKMGADFVINSTEKNLTDEITRATGGAGVPIIFDAIGTKETAENSILLAKKGAFIIWIGVTADKASINISDLIMKMLTVRGTSDFINDFPKAISLVGSRRLAIDSIVTDYFNFKDINEAFRYSTYGHKENIKTMINFD